MYENNRKHYRVAKREIYEDPFEGVYVTKEESTKNFLISLGLIALTFLVMIPLALKK